MVVINSIGRSAVGWLFGWAGADVVDVYVDGFLDQRDVAVSPVAVMPRPEDGGRCPDVELVAAGAVGPWGCSRVGLQWRAVADATDYVVREDGVVVAVIAAAAGMGYVTWWSGVKDDGQSFTHSVCARVGNVESVVVEKETRVVRNPRAPVCGATVIVEGAAVTLRISEVIGWGRF